jgi:hypothetical protein
MFIFVYLWFRVIIPDNEDTKIMLRSHDDLIRVEVVENIGNISPCAVDFSMVNVPVSNAQFKNVMDILYNSPTQKHITLLLNRHARKDRISALSNIGKISNFEYLDTISIWYERPSSCSNNGFLPVCEVGQLFYKGSIPDASVTAWAGEETSNATNLWSATPMIGEKNDKGFTYYQKFCWIVPSILMSLAQPLENRRFACLIDMLDSEYDSLFRFCRHYKIGVQLYVNTEAQAVHIIRQYGADYSDKEKV